MGAATIFVVGDGMSALVGSSFGGRKWPWSDQKTILGSVAFFVGATFAMHSLLSVLIQDALHYRLLLGVLPSVIGGLAEAMPVTLVRDIRDSKPDDNLLVILSSGASLHWLITYLRIEGI
jgi:dolichol kinase